MARTDPNTSAPATTTRHESSQGDRALVEHANPIGDIGLTQFINSIADRTRFAASPGSLLEAMLEHFPDTRSALSFFDLNKIDPATPLCYIVTNGDLAWLLRLFTPAQNNDLSKEEEQRAFIIQTLQDLKGDDLASVFRAAQNAKERQNPEKRKGKPDPTFDEIQQEVTLRWGQRHKLHPDADWTINPSTYVRHVFAKWLDAGTLRLRHLKVDLSLYTKYIAYVGAHPEHDLYLRREPVGGKKHEISAEARLERRREQTRASKIRKRARNAHLK